MQIGTRGGMKARPTRTYTTGPVTQLLRWLALAAAVVVTIWVLTRYSSLPEIIPIHYNLLGEADGWGSRSSVFLLVGTFLAMIIGIEVLSHFPRVFNYPVTITETNAQEVYRAGEQMMVWMNTLLAVMYTGLALALVISPDLLALVTISLIGMFAVLAAGIWRMIRAARTA